MKPPAHLPYLDDILQDLVMPLHDTLRSQGLKPMVQAGDGNWSIYFSEKDFGAVNAVSIRIKGSETTKKSRAGWMDATVRVDGNGELPIPLEGTNWSYLKKTNDKASQLESVGDLKTQGRTEFFKDLKAKVAQGKLVAFNHLKGKQKLTTGEHWLTLLDEIALHSMSAFFKKIWFERIDGVERLKLSYARDGVLSVHCDRGLLILNDNLQWVRDDRKSPHFTRAEDAKGMYAKIDGVVERQIANEEAVKVWRLEQEKLEEERRLVELRRIAKEQAQRNEKREQDRVRAAWSFVPGTTVTLPFTGNRSAFSSVLEGAETSMIIANDGVQLAVIGVFGKWAKISLMNVARPQAAACLEDYLKTVDIRVFQDPAHLGHVIDIDGAWYPLNELPEGLVVASSCSFLGTEQRELPNGMRVHGKLTLGTQMNVLPADLKVYSLDLRYSFVRVLRGDLMVRDMIHAAKSWVDTVEKGIVTGGADLRNTGITRLPDGFQAGHLDVSWSRLEAYPKGLVVKSLTCEGIELPLPDDLTFREERKKPEQEAESEVSAGPKM